MASHFSRTLPMLIPALLCAAAAHAQPGGPSGEPRWVALDATPPGTPPSLMLSPLSDQFTTVLDITLHGFYVRDVVMGNGATYQAISLATDQTPAAGDDGKPDLPALPILIGVPTDAVPTKDVQVTDLVTLSGYTIAPRQPDFEMLPDASEVAPAFTIDQVFYDSMNTPYPSNGATLGVPPGEIYGINIQALTFNPISVIPATGTLRIRHTATLRIFHAGVPLPQRDITSRHGRELSSALINYPVLVGGYVTIDTRHYDGYFLFVTTSDNLPRLQPLITQKSQRGFGVTVSVVAPGTPSPAIKSIIQSWYNARPVGSDKFVILGGNGQDIPTVLQADQNGNFRQSDHDYACLTGGDVYPEVRLGRISSGPTAAAIVNPVTKILRYEDTPLNSSAYAYLDLVAMREDINWSNSIKNLCQDTMEIVAAGAYVTPPAVTTRFGMQNTGTNALLTSDINSGRGVIMYLGHGSTGSWGPWDYAGQTFGYFQIAPLTNALQPVVFAHACNTTHMSVGISAGEQWTSIASNAGAAAYYGAAETMYVMSTAQRTPTLAHALYDQAPGAKATMISWVTDLAFVTRLGAGGPYVPHTTSDWYASLLLGDPEMLVYTRNPAMLNLSPTPPQQGFHLGNNSSMMNVMSGSGAGGGAPVAMATVVLSQPGRAPVNALTDSAGNVTLQSNLVSGPLTLYAYTDGQDSVPVILSYTVCPADADGNGLIQPADVAVFINTWFTSLQQGTLAGDFDGNGAVQPADVGAFINAWFSALLNGC